MDTVLIVAVIFLFSLAGASILFRFFESAAIIENKHYKAGGAIAGFLLIYGALYYSFYEIENSEFKQQNEIISNKNKILNKEISTLKNTLEGKIVSGVVLNKTSEVKVILATKHTDIDSDGRFFMKASCLNPKENEIRLYVITEGSHVSSTLEKLPIENVEINLSRKMP